MIIDVSELRKENTNLFKFNEEIDLKKENTEFFSFVKPVFVDLEIKLFMDEVLLSVEYSSEVEYTCVRCLKKFNEKIEGKFETAFLNKEDYDNYVKSDEKEHYFDSEEVLKELMVREKIDTTEMIRDYVILNISEYPICDIECAGLDEINKYKQDAAVDQRFQKLLDIANNSSKI